MVIEMPVKLGTVDLHNVLNWEEEEVSSVPVKRVIRKSSPTVQAQYFVREPRRITLTVRLTAAEKASLRTLKNLFQWQELCDFEAVGACTEFNPEFVDFVWIEKISTRWSSRFKSATCDTPWVYVINLICSQT